MKITIDMIGKKLYRTTNTTKACYTDGSYTGKGKHIELVSIDAEHFHAITGDGKHGSRETWPIERIVFDDHNWVILPDERCTCKRCKHCGGVIT